MNKKIIVIAVALVALIGVGSFFASKSIEGQVEEFIRSEIAKTPVKVEKVEYTASSGTLLLTNISYEDTFEDFNLVMKASSARVEGFNDEILDPESTNFHVFDELYLDNLSYALKMDGTFFSETKADSMHVKNYQQDIRTLWAEWQKDATSEAFFTALLTQAFDSIVVKKYALIVNPDLLDGVAGMTAEELVFDAVNFMDWSNHPQGQAASGRYNTIKIMSSDVDIEMDSLIVKDFLFPHPKLYTAFASTVLKNSESEKVADLHALTPHIESYALGEKPIFENVTMNGTKIILKKDAPQNIKDSAIYIGRVAMDMEAGNTMSFAFTLDKLSLSSEYIYPELDPTYVPLVRAFIGDTISFDFYTKHALNFSKNEYFIKTETSVANMATASVEGVALADLKGSKVEKIYHLFNDIDELKFNNIAFTYADLGLLPFIGQVAVKETRLPLEALLPVATAEVQNFLKSLDRQMEAEKAKLTSLVDVDDTAELNKATENFQNQEKLYLAVKQIGDMCLKMLEKPGSFTANFAFSEPITARDAADQILALLLSSKPSEHAYVDIDFSLDVKQGEKTFLEATPQELLKK